MPDPIMTPRQLTKWPEAVAEAQRYVDTSTIPVDPNHPMWMLDYTEEVRPGRGHDISAIWMDGEYAVRIMIDVYGHHSVSVAETDWLHNSDCEQCDCHYCMAEYHDEEYDHG